MLASLRAKLWFFPAMKCNLRVGAVVAGRSHVVALSVCATPGVASNHEGSPTGSVTPRAWLSPPGAAQAGVTSKTFSGFSGHSSVLYGPLSGVLTLSPGFNAGRLRWLVNVDQGLGGRVRLVQCPPQPNDSFKRDTPCRGIVGVKVSSGSRALFQLHCWRAS